MPADFRPDPEVSPDFLLHALLLAHFNAQQSGLRRRGLPHLGSPKILFLLMRYPEDGSSAPSQKELADLLRISPATVARLPEVSGVVRLCHPTCGRTGQPP